ncbi:uncharacterized protein LOC129726983 [Wyeomyia smithii]|uniref:uncharacterized protein LOC129726983 n=1 Tax=Wyeomyia smithii TaxID=174621 RepID=UPI002467D1EE|nr:uncharacterized protein LOC129726983 [Wyeomyia smithii]
MKCIVAVLCSVVLALAVQAYPTEVDSYSKAWPVSSTVWPAYGGLYGKSAYPAWGGWSAWPAYGKSWAYGAPLAYNGLWNYGGIGYGQYW